MTVYIYVVGFLTAVLTASICYVWSLPLAFLPLIGLQCFKETTPHKVALIQKRLPKRASIIDSGEPVGWIYGKWYIGFISVVQSSGQHSGTTVEIFIVSTHKFYNKLTEDANAANGDSPKITIYNRTGNYYYIRYKPTVVAIREKKSKTKVNYEGQLRCVNAIVDHYDSNETTVVCVSGKPGTGKSTIAKMLAKRFEKASLCDTFNPTEPCDEISTLYNSVSPSKKSPLIIVFEEVDAMLYKVHNGLIPLHVNSPISIRDKTSWNTFLDRLGNGYFPYVILLMTTNQNRDYFDGSDPAYMREGRVDEFFILDEKKKEKNKKKRA